MKTVTRIHMGDATHTHTHTRTHTHTNTHAHTHTHTPRLKYARSTKRNDNAILENRYTNIPNEK